MIRHGETMVFPTSTLVPVPCCDDRPCQCERVIESVADLRAQDIDAAVMWLRDADTPNRWPFAARLLHASVRQQAVLMGVFGCACLDYGCWRCR